MRLFSNQIQIRSLLLSSFQLSPANRATPVANDFMRSRSKRLFGSVKTQAKRVLLYLFFFSIYPVISALSPKTPLRSQKVAKVSHWPKSIGHSRLANFLIKLKAPNARITVILICIRSSMIFAILFWNWAEWSNILVVWEPESKWNSKIGT